MTFFDYARAHGFALFPCAAGAKTPVPGFMWKSDHSSDSARWEKWRTEHGQNFGIVAGASRLIIVDIDTTKEGGRDGAWSRWCAWCAEHDLPTFAPHVSTARQGMHFYFRVPDDIDAAALSARAIAAGVDVKAGYGYTVAPGSYYDGSTKGEASGAYTFFPNAPAPHAAPAALIEHCTRREVMAPTTAPVVNSYDPADVATLLRFLTEQGEFAGYDEWLRVGMALRAEFGDAGLDLWAITHDETVTDDVISSKWRSFDAESKPGAVTLSTFFQRAHAIGWRGSVRQSVNAMFGSLPVVSSPSIAPGIVGGRGAKQAEAWAPILAACPKRLRRSEHPTMPDTGHPLHAAINDAIPGIIETGSVDALAIVEAVHPQTAAIILAMLPNVDVAAVKARAAGLIETVENALAVQSDFVRDQRGEPQNDNVDNVRFFLRQLAIDIRWNAWTERMELCGWQWPKWTEVNDTVVAKLRTRGSQTGTRFRPSKEFTWDSLLSLAHENTVDPLLDRLRELENSWDREPRLVTWLTTACGVPDDAYHQAVGRNIIGGMVRRARDPGVKHDTAAVFHGGQGTGKSTAARILALRQEWFSDEIELGEASKELVLSLAGKWVVEIGEMGTKRGVTADHTKAMISRQVDRGRTAYARTVTDRPRRNIFIGTVNSDTPLTDPTGNRRFLPVACDRPIDLDWLRANVEQLIGEAAHFESAGETFELPPSVWAAAAEKQNAATEAPEWQVHVTEWLMRYELPVFMTSADLSHIVSVAAGGRPVKRSNYVPFIKSLGFRSTSKRIAQGEKPASVWCRGDSKSALRLTAVTMPGKAPDVRSSMTVDGTPSPLPPAPQRAEAQ